jgi:hypothetical protein
MARKAITEFGKTLRKNVIIPEKEAPLAASDVTDDSNVSADASVNPESVNPVESVEQTIAKANATIAASKEFTAEFGDTPIDD